MKTNNERHGNNYSLELIVPIFNEMEVIPTLLARLSEVFSKDKCQAVGVSKVSFLFIDDGSKDKSAAMLADAITGGFPGTLFRLSRNFGHQNAVTCGIDASQADMVAVIDADLQDPPELVLDMVRLWREGNDVVFGQRRARKENMFLKMCYWLAYRLINVMSETTTALDSGDFCLMDRAVVDQLKKLPEKLRYIRGLRSWVGFPQIGLIYDRPARAAGESKYTLLKLYKLATDGIAAMSTRPLRLLQVVAFVFMAAAVGEFGLELFWGNETLTANKTFLLVLISAAVQMFAIYILGAYVGRTYIEVKNRPCYIVMQIIKGQDNDGK
jgi:dolichol-phosphate mannosyltransferase